MLQELFAHLPVGGGYLDSFVLGEGGVLDLICPRRDLDPTHLAGIIIDVQVGDGLVRDFLFENDPPGVRVEVVAGGGLDGGFGVVLLQPGDEAGLLRGLPLVEIHPGS